MSSWWQCLSHHCLVLVFIWIKICSERVSVRNPHRESFKSSFFYRMQAWWMHSMHHKITVGNILWCRVSCERKAIEKNHIIPCPSSKNNKWHQQERNSEDLGETKKTGFSKHKIRAHAAAWDADFISGQDCMKVAGLWRKKLSCMVRKMYYRRILIINYPLSDNCAKKISANKGWLKQVLQLLLTLTTHAIVLN